LDYETDGVQKVKKKNKKKELTTIRNKEKGDEPFRKTGRLKGKLISQTEVQRKRSLIRPEIRRSSDLTGRGSQHMNRRKQSSDGTNSRKLKSRNLKSRSKEEEERKKKVVDESIKLKRRPAEYPS